MSELPTCIRCGGEVRRVVGTDGRSGLVCEVCKAAYTLTPVPERGGVVGAAPHASTGSSHPFGAPDPSGDLRAVRSAVALPDGLTVTTGPERLVISWSWWGLSALFLVVMALFWNGFMVIWYTIAITSREWLMGLFGTLHAVVGIGLAYNAAAHVLNRTSVTLTPVGVSVRHGPLPWRGQISLPRDQLAQVFVRRDESIRNNRQVVQYSVVARRRDGGDTDLVSGVEDLGAARFLERRIEEVFGLEDVAVPGEVSRT